MTEFMKELHWCLSQNILYAGPYAPHGAEWLTNTNKLGQLSRVLKRIIVREERTRRIMDFTCVDRFISTLYKYISNYNLRNGISYKTGVTLFV